MLKEKGIERKKERKKERKDTKIERNKDRKETKTIAVEINEMMTKSILHAKNLSFHFARIIFDLA